MPAKLRAFTNATVFSLQPLQRCNDFYNLVLLGYLTVKVLAKGITENINKHDNKLHAMAFSSHHIHCSLPWMMDQNKEICDQSMLTGQRGRDAEMIDANEYMAYHLNCREGQLLRLCMSSYLSSVGSLV